MNRTMARALLEDAFHQVLDNRIFRLLLIVVLGLVAPTFLIGFGQHEVTVLWGWQRVTYDQLFAYILAGRRIQDIANPQAEAIQVYQQLVVGNLCGTVGMVFCIAATAFFVPRMLERGSADVLFSKPFSRMTLLFARYVSGVLFVGLLAAALVGGMYLGFRIVSGYSDTGFLWGALTLVYLYAIIHGVSMLAGVVTRSTIASTLIALVFFMGSGCVHQIWRIRTYFVQNEVTKKLRAQMESSGEDEAPLPPILDEEPGTFTRLLLGTLDTLHYTLPKTSDADLITRKLRKALDRKHAAIVDDAIRLTVPDAPEGFAPEPGSLPLPSGGRIPVDLSKRPVVWVRDTTEDPGSARIEISRRSRSVERTDGDGRARTRRLTVGLTIDEWIERARTSGRLDSEPTQHKGRVDGLYAVFVEWYEKAESGREHVQVVVFSTGDWLVEIVETADADWTTAEERASHLARFLDGLRVAREADLEDPDKWYERQFTATAPLPFNVFFSIGSSIAFTVLMLSLAVWKLSRTDF